MKNNVTLIAATHSVNEDANGHRTTMGYQSDKDFFAKYGDQITEKTLIITEGGYWEKVTTSTHRLYQDRLKRISPLLSQYNKTPHLLFFDYRHAVKREITENYVKHLVRLQTFFNAHFKFDKPNSEAELKTFVFNENYISAFVRDPDFGLRAAAKKFLFVEQQTNEYFMRAISQHENSYDHVFLIVGSTHAMSIAKQENCDFVVLKSHFNEKQNLHQIFGAYLFAEKLPRLIESQD